jgi:hypothetical protein
VDYWIYLNDSDEAQLRERAQFASLAAKRDAPSRFADRFIRVVR